ncbi:heme NO-binding domain-containing protein [Sphingomonas lacunae]|nr:heme NO-binding domain-containing protein [Sphingomonas lacunae]
MYGLFHRAIREMMANRLGSAGWAELERGLGLGAADYITARVYADDQTIGICSACADALGQPLPDFFFDFGVYWVEFAASGPYRGVMQSTGTTLAEMLANLDRMHNTIRQAMPQAQTPLFALVEDRGDSLIIDYRSPREGLEPLVSGLLTGLLDYFGEQGSVTRLQEHDGRRFHIQLGRGQA